jgi:hypothetical protein
MNPPVLSGSDPEDYASGGVLTSKNVIIDSIPANAQLYYKNTLVVNGQAINNFNPDSIQVKFTGATIGSTSLYFKYSYVDAANMKDPTPATYKLVWFIPLPVDGLTASATLNSTVATVKWSTLTEQNTSHYIVERSLDGVNYTATGNNVPAAGNSSEKREYQMQDNVSSLMQKQCYLL